MAELRTVPNYYIWFLLEGTPPINLTLVNTSTSLEGGFIKKGFQINQTGTYKYTLLAENSEGNDSKTVDVTVLGKDSMLLNFFFNVDVLNFVLIVSVDDSVHWVKNECTKFLTTCSCFAIVLNTGNLCPFRFVNNANLSKYNIGNLVSPLINK